MDLRHKEIDRHTVPRKDSSDSLSILWFTTYPLAQTSGEFDQGKYRFCIMWMAFLRISYRVFDFKLYVFISLDWCCAHWMEEKDYGEDPKRNNIDSFNGFWLDVKKVKNRLFQLNFSRFFSSSWLLILQNVFCSFLCVCRTRRSSAQQNKRKCNKNKSTHNESWELSVKNSTSIYNLYATSLPLPITSWACQKAQWISM